MHVPGERSGKPEGSATQRMGSYHAVPQFCYFCDLASPRRITAVTGPFVSSASSETGSFRGWRWTRGRK